MWTWKTYLLTKPQYNNSEKGRNRHKSINGWHQGYGCHGGGSLHVIII